MIREAGNTETHRNWDRVDGFLLNQTSGPFGNGKSFLGRMISEDHGDFLAAVTVYLAFAPGSALQAPGEFAQNSVTNWMPVRVVHCLKVIDVDEYQAERQVLTYGLTDCLLEGSLERPSAEELGQIVPLLQRTSILASGYQRSGSGAGPWNLLLGNRLRQLTDNSLRDTNRLA